MKRVRAGKTSRGANIRRALGAAAAVASIGLCGPSAALAGPATDEYTLDLPDAKGKVESPQQTPTANLASLPSGVAARLQRDPLGKTLAGIATAGELGAPSPSAKGPGAAGVAGEQPSTVSAVASALGDPVVLGLILLLALVGGALMISRARTETHRQ
jgi:hypothetical protein